MLDTAIQTWVKPAKVLIIDHHPIFREGLTIQISRLTDLEVCGEADDGTDALQLVDTTRPDIVIVDSTLTSGNGIDLIKHFKERNPPIRVLVWSMHVDCRHAERALRAGAEGYINKSAAADQVIEAIRYVLAGRIYLSQPMADQLLRRFIGGVQQTQGTPPIERLSDRELETYRLIGEGLSTKEVAHKLATRLRTVETFLARIKKKFDLENRQQLVEAATQWVLENH